MALVSDLIDGVGCVVAQVQATIPSRNRIDGSAPFVVTDQKARNKVLVAGWTPILDANADNFVARLLASVPRAVEAHKRITSVVRRELSTRVKADSQRRGMRLKRLCGRERRI